MIFLRAKVFQSSNAWAKLAERSPKYLAVARHIISTRQVDAVLMGDWNKSRKYCGLLAKLPDCLVRTQVSSSRVQTVGSVEIWYLGAAKAPVHRNRPEVDDSWKPRLPVGVS